MAGTVSAIDLDSFLFPSVKLSKLIHVLNDQSSGFARKIDINELKGAPKSVVLSTGRGFASDVFRVDFTSKDATVTSVVVKIPKVDTAVAEAGQAFVNLMREVHRNEINFFEMVRAEKNAFGLTIPEFYYGEEIGTDNPGMIVMENLADKMSAASPPFYGYYLLTDQLIKEEIGEIVKLQKMGFQVKEGKEVVGQIPIVTEFLKGYAVDAVKAVLEKTSFLDDNQRRVVNSVKSWTSQDRKNVAIYLNLPLVLIHNDFWPGNMLFKDETEFVANVDWQTTTWGCMTDDLALLLALNMTGKDRLLKEKEFVRFYFESMEASLREHCGKAVTFETIWTAYNQSKREALYRVIMTFNNYNEAKKKQANGEQTGLEEILSVLTHELVDIIASKN